MTKSYKDLPSHEEIELNHWLRFLEDSVYDAHLQIERWEQTRNFWNLYMFFIAMVWIDDSIENLRRFLSHDEELWSPLKEFNKKVKRHKLRTLRNDIVHRKKIFKWQDKDGNPLPESSVRILGGYHVDKDEFTFGTHKIILSDVFGLVQTLEKDIRALLESRLAEFHEKQSYDGIIPFNYLRRFRK